MPPVAGAGGDREDPWAWVDPLDAEVAVAVEHAEQRNPDSSGRRALDLLISIPAFVVTLPLVLVIAAVSAYVFRAWPFFVHSRVGRGGRPFRFVKIRSLPADVPEYVDKYALRGCVGHGWTTFIRRSHLDELPQLWHVIRGQMSLVGPRPEMVPVSGRFDPGFGRARVLVRPGCTGLWQISANNAHLIGEAPQFDLFYLRFASVRLDLWVLWRTVIGLLPWVGTVSLAQVPAGWCGLDGHETARYGRMVLRPAWRKRREISAELLQSLECEGIPTVEEEVPVLDHARLASRGQEVGS